MTRTPDSFLNLSLGCTLLAALMPSLGCGDDDDTSETQVTGESGDGDGDATGDGDGDPTTGDGDGDGDPTGDGDGDGDSDPACALEWEATQMKVNGQTHAAYAVAVGADGNFAAVGKIENSSDDAWVALFTPAGEVIWEHTVDGGDGPDAAIGVAIDDAGDVALVGRQFGPTHQDLWIEKRTAAAGAVAWSIVEVSQFDGDNDPGGIAVAPDGDFVVSGSLRTGDKDTDIWVRKLATTDGAAVWTSTFSGSVDANGFSIDNAGPVAVAPDGSVYASGNVGVDFETKEAVLLRYGADGAEQWAITPRADTGPHIHDVTALAAGPDGEGYFVTYQSGNLATFWLERVTPTGEVAWTLTVDDFQYDPTDGWFVGGLAIADDGTLTAGGRLTNEEVGQAITWSEAWIANIGLDGVGQCIASHTWQNTHIIPARTFGYGIDEGPNGAIVVGEVIDGPENYLWLGGFK